MPKLDLSRPCSISIRQQHPTVDLAARELAGFITTISGQQASVIALADGVDVQSAPDALYFQLDFSPNGDDGFSWRVGSTIHLHGNNPRGLLYAVYSFLERLGCCWPAPGERYQVLPQGTLFELPESLSEAPGLPGRCLIIGHQAFMQDVAEWVIWAARNRLNTIFFHTTTGSLALGAVPESQYQALKPIFLPLMQERGMLLEHGGHGLTELLPRERFSDLPDAFRMKDGTRTPDHNFCPSSEEGLQIIRQNAEKHFRAHPEVDVFHLWGDDIPGGGWCGCERCAPFSASAQLLMAVNQLADVLAGVNPAAQISLIAYHDTEAVPYQVQPRANVHVLWAPRMRCYGHPLTDDACRLNQPKYTQTVRDQVEYFRSAGAAPMRVFEYYLDAVLFKSVMPPLPTVIQRDAQFYRQAGVHNLQALMTGDYPWTTPQLNVWLFPRLCWNPDADMDALIRQFSAVVYGANLVGYYRALEQAFSLALTIEPEQMKIVVSHGIDSIWANPPADMGDPIFAPPALLTQKLDKNASIQTWLERAESELDAAAPDENALLQGERDHFRLLKGWLTFDYARLQLYAAIVGGDTQEIRLKWLQAHKALGEVYRWGKRFIASPQYRLNFEFIQFYTWHIRLNKIRAGYLSGPAGRRRVELAVKTKLAGYYARLRHLFDAPAKP